MKNNPVTSHFNTFINRAKHVHDPGLKTIKMVENELRENNFFTSKNALWRSLPKQTQYPTFCKVLHYLEESNKIAYDKDGNIIWIFVESKKAEESLEDSTDLNLSEKAQMSLEDSSVVNVSGNMGRLTISCREVGVDCDYVGKGDTEEELMNNLIDHAIKDHGYTREDVLNPEIQEKIKAHIHKS